ncbi:hypothetical protein [Candidatus Bealeia paramacronuclearis]|uniref:hypothetical protein n=1 Tax=Candidatus Bealeia paramacronuclearis TaxID=1921001 RepID=UPI002F267619
MITFYGNDQDATNVIAFPNGDDFDETSLPLDDVDVSLAKKNRKKRTPMDFGMTLPMNFQKLSDKVVTDLIRGISEDKGVS